MEIPVNNLGECIPWDIGILPSRHFDVRMTSYENFIVDFGFGIQKYSSAPNLSKIKPISWQICKFLHFSIP